MKMNPIKPVIKVKTNEALDKDEGKSIKDEEESTETSQELSEEQNATSDIYNEDQEDSKSIETSQVHSSETLSLVDRATSYLISSSSSLWVFVN